MAKKKKKKKSGPSEPRPLNIAEITAQAQAASAANLASLRNYYQQTAGDIGSSAYSQQALQQANAASAQARRLQDMAGEVRTTAADNAERVRAYADPIVSESMAASGRINAIGDQLMGLSGMVDPQQTLLERQIGRLGASAMGVRADQVMGPSGIREVDAMRIRAGQVGAGQLGDTIMARAMERAQSTGRLSAEAERDAIQSARQGMAARGLATGNAALGAELLNRDRYARGRMEEDLAFARGVQSEDVARQFQNVANRMTASQANQNAMLQAALANQNRDQSLAQMGMEAQRLNQAANMTQAEANRAFMLNANNAANAGSLQRLGVLSGLLGQAGDAYGSGAQTAVSGLGMGAGLQESAGNMRLAGDTAGANIGQAAGNMLLNTSQAVAQQNPYNIALGGLGAGAGMIQSGSDLASGVASFNTNMAASMYNSYMNNQAAMQSARMGAGASQQAGMMGMFGGIGAGALAGVGAAI
jgi:hypothetical protein